MRVYIAGTDRRSRGIYRKRGLPPDCHPDRPHVARGLCASCYYRSRRPPRVPRREIECLLCGRLFEGNSRQRFCSRSCRTRDRNRRPGAREKAAAYLRGYRATERGRTYVRRMNLHKFGITSEDYDALLERQGSVCAACHMVEIGRNQFGPLRLAVDHDHKTGTIRGLLCMQCNRALGLLGDNPDRVESLAKYRRSLT